MERSRLLSAIAMIAAIPLAILTSEAAPASKEIWVPKKPKPVVEGTATGPEAANPASSASPASPTVSAGPDTGPTIVPKPAPPKPPPETPKPTPAVVVGATSNEPIVEGKTVLWTAAFQTAW